MATNLLGLAALCAPAQALNTTAVPDISDAQVAYFLNNPAAATRVRYDLKDSAGQAMHLPSIVQLSGPAPNYAAAYTTPYPVKGGTRFRVNLAVSADLMNWTHVGVLVDNADMAKLTRVPGSKWLVLTHEQWKGRREASTHPSRVAFKLYHDDFALLARRAAASLEMPAHGGNLNGTPSPYSLRVVQREGKPSLDGVFGFHFWNGTRDVNGHASLARMFEPRVASSRAMTATAYNTLFRAVGVTGNLGDRDTLVTTSGRFNVQEGNVGRPKRSWDKWRLFLYKFREGSPAPDASGTVMPLAPRTHKGSTSFGNPTINVVDLPDGSGQALVVSYFIFSEGQAPGEAGSLLYYFAI